MVWGEIDEETHHFKTDNVWLDMWKHVSDASKRREKQKWAIEKPELDNARQTCGIFFVEP